MENVLYDTFSSEMVHGNQKPFSAKSRKFRNDVNRHLQEGFINNFNCSIEIV